jgi:hypothetical protein
LQGCRALIHKGDHCRVEIVFDGKHTPSIEAA